MNYAETMKQLKKLGSAKVTEIYERHGAKATFGVKFGDLKKLQKKIKIDHELAKKLWDSGNVDAQSLATMIIDLKSLTKSELARMVKKIDFAAVSSVFASNVSSKTPYALELADSWSTATSDYVRATAYHVLASLSKTDKKLQDDVFIPFIKRIENDIATSKDRAKLAMNDALIAIGERNPKLRAMAIAAAQRIGSVEVDHGETNCKTADAVRSLKT